MNESITIKKGLPEADNEVAATITTPIRDALLTFYDFPAKHWIHL